MVQSGTKDQRIYLIAYTESSSLSQETRYDVRLDDVLYSYLSSYSLPHPPTDYSLGIVCIS